MKRLVSAVIAAGSLLAACATVPPAAFGAELVGQQLQVVGAGGQMSITHLMPDGTAHLSDSGRHLTGRWAMEGKRICFTYPGLPYECWSYNGPLRKGMTLPFTSDRGRTVQVTML